MNYLKAFSHFIFRMKKRLSHRDTNRKTSLNIPLIIMTFTSMYLEYCFFLRNSCQRIIHDPRQLIKRVDNAESLQDNGLVERNGSPRSTGLPIRIPIVIYFQPNKTRLLRRPREYTKDRIIFDIINGCTEQAFSHIQMTHPDGLGESSRSNGLFYGKKR